MSGVLGFLFKHFVERATNEAIAKEKEESEKRVAELRAHFELINSQNNFRYSVVFNRTDKTIHELITLITAARFALGQCRYDYENIEWGNFHIAAGACLKSLFDYLMTYSLYIPEQTEKTARRLEEHLHRFYEIVGDVKLLVDSSKTEQEKKVPMEALEINYNNCIKNIEATLQELQKEFRLILGVPILEPVTPSAPGNVKPI